MRRILNTAHIYMILGVVGGLYYRELTKAEDFTGDSQLGVVHTHLLALGMLFFLIVLVLEKQFGLTGSRLFPWFYWIYNAGLALTVGMMTVHGTLTVLGRGSGAAIAGIAGLGHILLTAGLVLLFVCLGKRLPAGSGSAPGSAPDTADRPAEAAPAGPPAV
ncbi:DUF2871 domain-containing protein [Streptomyces sp. NRRL B-24484]|uniref:DUF2871 domain-containing protein n=1 Tax=Streptomyces sp. NRRL B-24484 TaxID=1463833 RepID=UPI00069492EA|nr:DUF2871 domain-containing protein [Streptomyces sp. NRRL B-24484]